MWWWLSGKRSSCEVGMDDLPRTDDEWRVAAKGVPALRQALPQISAEFARACRYERTVTIVVFSVAHADPDASSATGGNGRNASTGGPDCLAGVLASAMREMDLVTCDPAARCCVVVMPEIGAEEGRRAVSRMSGLCSGRLGRPIEAGIAVFPQDGWSFLDLVDVALRQARAVNEKQAAQTELNDMAW